MLMDGGIMVRALCANLRSCGKFTGLKVYTETVRQNFTTPCFFVNQIYTAQAKAINDRYLREYREKIAYVPKSTATPEKECREVSETLFDTLKIIKLQDTGVEVDGETVFSNAYIRPLTMEFEIVDGKVTKELRFTMDLRCYLRQPVYDVLMQRLELDIELDPITL